MDSKERDVTSTPNELRVMETLLDGEKFGRLYPSQIACATGMEVEVVEALIESCVEKGFVEQDKKDPEADFRRALYALIVAFQESRDESYRNGKLRADLEELERKGYLERSHGDSLDEVYWRATDKARSYVTRLDRKGKA